MFQKYLNNFWRVFSSQFSFSESIFLQCASFSDLQFLTRLWQIFPSVSHDSLQGVGYLQPTLSNHTLADISVCVVQSSQGAAVSYPNIPNETVAGFLSMPYRLTIFSLCLSRPSTSIVFSVKVCRTFVSAFRHHLHSAMSSMPAVSSHPLLDPTQSRLGFHCSYTLDAIFVLSLQKP